MTTLPANHLARIANFYGEKLDEMKFFLEKVVDCCDQSRALFISGQPQQEKSGKILTFTFSAYTNTIQTLKEAAGMLLGKELPWNQVRALRHGAFMYSVRNAMTHDGNPVISAWSDGRYYVPSKIIRLNKEKKVVVISPPKEDVRKFCLEFSADFAELLGETLSQIPEDERTSVSIFDIDEFDEMLNDDSFIPEEVRLIMAKDRDMILESIKNTNICRIDASIRKAAELATYCNAKLLVET